MDEHFEAEEFVDKLIAGKFDGQVSECVSGLSDEQLHQVTLILGQRISARHPRTT